MATVRGSAPPANQVLERAFAPMHKRALGLAVGLTAGLVVFLVTVFHVTAHPDDGPSIGLLSAYFYGYRVTWQGAFIGFWWALVAGFTAGWFVAFLHNLGVAIWIFWIRAKASFVQTSDFLDHI